MLQPAQISLLSCLELDPRGVKMVGRAALRVEPSGCEQEMEQ